MRRILLVLFVPAILAADKVDPAVEAFREQLAKPSGLDLEKFRLEVSAFVRAKTGTPASPQAAALLNKLPSPLDKLDPKTIPELDRFPWQQKELVAVLGEHRGRHGSAVTCVVATRDGKHVISGGSNGYVRIWNSGTLRQEARVGTGAVSSLTVSSDNKTLAAGTSGGAVTVWDISGETPKQTGHFGLGSSGVNGIAISPDNKLLAAGVYDGLVHTFDLEGSTAKVRTQLAGHKSAVTATQFSTDSHSLAAAAADGTVRWWDFKGEKINELGSLAVHTGAISCMVYNPRLAQLVVGCGDGTVVRVTTMGKYAKGATFKAPSPVTSIAFGPQTNALTTGHADSVVRIWGNTTGPKPVATTTIGPHFSSVTGFAYLPDNRTIVTGSSDWTVRLWTIAGASGTERFPLRGHWVGPTLAFSPDGLLLASGSGDRTSRIWDIAKAAPVQHAQFPPTPALLKNEAMGVSSLAFRPDGKALAVSGTGAIVKLWDIPKRSLIRDYTSPAASVGSLLFTPDGASLFAIGSNLFFGWTTSSGKEVVKITPADRYINGLAISPDGRFALVGTGYYVIEKGKPLVKDGKNVYQDIAFRMFDLRRGQGIHEKKDFGAPMGGVSYLPDGRAVCAVWNATPTLWDATREGLKEKEPLTAIAAQGHPYNPSLDQQRLLYAVNTTFRIVDFDKGTVLKTFACEETVSSVVFSNDRRYVAVSLVTGPIYILRLEEPPPPVSGK